MQIGKRKAELKVDADRQVIDGGPLCRRFSQVNRKWEQPALHLGQEVKPAKVLVVIDNTKSMQAEFKIGRMSKIDDLLIGKSKLLYSRYSPKLANFVKSLWYGRKGAGQVGKRKSVSIIPNRVDVLATVVVVAAVVVAATSLIDAALMLPPQTTRHSWPALAA